MTIPEDTAEIRHQHVQPALLGKAGARYVDECMKGKDGGREKNFNMRWVCSMVAEVHRILTRGGIFMRIRSTPRPSKAGKLRLICEKANPMSFIVEQAGAMSSTGRERIMELQTDRFASTCTRYPRFEEGSPSAWWVITKELENCCGGRLLRCAVLEILMYYTYIGFCVPCALHPSLLANFRDGVLSPERA